MPGWRDSLRPASFRGVEFFVSDISLERGRRWARHEYPGRDIPYHEDMGRRVRLQSVTAYVLEPDHIGKARALIKACEAPGPATLVHPWLGGLRVVCVQCRQVFNRDQGGVAAFELEFAEAGLARYPEASVNDVNAVDEAGLNADEAMLRQMEDDFSVEGMPDYVSDDAGGMLSSFQQSAKATLEPILFGAQAAAQWTRSAFATIQEVQSLVRNPLAMGERIFGLLDIGNVGGLSGVVHYGLELAGQARTLFTDPGQSPLWQQYGNLSNWKPQFPSIPETTAARRQQKKNRDTFVSFVRAGATIESARAAVRQDFGTYNEATEARDFIVARLEEESEVVASDEVYQTLTTLKAVVVSAIGKKAPLLPRLLSYTPHDTTPSLVLSNRLYGDSLSEIVDRSDEIVARNNIRNPLFVPGGSPLLVLTTVQ